MTFDGVEAGHEDRGLSPVDSPTTKEEIRIFGTVEWDRSVPLVVLATIGWALCGAIIGVGRSITSMEKTLIAHAIGAPIVFGVIAYVYFRRWGHIGPLQTAAVFVGIVIFLDVFVVALLVERSFEMFRSVLGTWIPWALIFAATWFVGRYVRAAPEPLTAA